MLCRRKLPISKNAKPPRNGCASRLSHCCPRRAAQRLRSHQMAWLLEFAEEWCSEFVLGRLVETKVTPPRFGFTFSVVLLIIPTSTRVMLHLIALAGLLVSQVFAEAASQPRKKSLLAFNRERCDFCR